MSRVGLVVASVGLGLALCVASAAPALAQEASTDETEARALFEAGRVAFADGRFDEALSHFTRSYELSERPVLTFNVGSAHDRLGHVGEAITWFERYLELVPDAENRSFVEARLGVLRATRDAHAADSEDTADPGASETTLASSEPQSTPSPPGSGADEGAAVASGVLFALAGLAGGSGLGLGVHTLSLQTDLETRCPAGNCDEGARSQVDALAASALATDILLGASLACAIGGTIALVLHLSQSPTDASVEPVVGLGVLGARGRF